MQVVTTIRPGHIIRTDADDFTVRGNMSVRGRYLYVCTNKAGRKVSLSREDVLDAQREGSAKVVAA